MEHQPLAAQKASQNDDDDEEEAHFQQVCRSYQQYATFHQTAFQGVGHRVRKMLNVTQNDGGNHSDGHKKGPTVASVLPAECLPGTAENQQLNKAFCNATIRNQFFLDSVLRYSGVPTSQEVLRDTERTFSRIDWATEDQMSKINSVLKSVARDWSAEGIEERSVVYDRILSALKGYMPLDEYVPKRVAVPGSGLGRLAWEIHAKGYTVEGSDFSLPMLLASDFVLNGCAIPDRNAQQQSRFRQFNISPWIAETKNVTSFDARIRDVTVPDVDPSSIQNAENRTREPALFSMLAGEFLSLYSHFLPEQKAMHNCTHHSQKFHAIACSFFLDTAPSLPEYLITIYHMLEDGGVLLHFGPLMYHWSGHGALLPKDLDGMSTPIDDMNGRYQSRNAYLEPRYLSSVDFTWEEVRQMIINTGFEIEEEEMNIPALYTSNQNSMMEVSYRCVFLVARKKSS